MQPSEFWSLTGADFVRYLDDLTQMADELEQLED